MKINYQIMEEYQKNGDGKYIPDFDQLIADATCEEEAAYIRDVKERTERYLSTPGYESMAGFAFNMVYVTRQRCGHFEMFQSPMNEHHPLEEVLEQAEEHTKMDCTRCICNWG